MLQNLPLRVNLVDCRGQRDDGLRPPKLTCPETCTAIVVIIG